MEENQSRKRLFLIDAMSHIFRAFFAPVAGRQEPLRNSKGQVTQAVFIFTNMLRKLLVSEKPDYIAVVFDSAEKTFRHESFESYKANRDEMPEELASQMPYIFKVCEAFNVSVIKMPGYEADDIIGTLAVKAAEKGVQAVIVSNDKDFCQLVKDPLIVCLRHNPQNIKRRVPVPPIEWCDEAWVKRKFGVPPSKIVDLLGLMGDPIDNIPGAKGIGEKGALSLVLQFGSAEEAIKRADEVRDKRYRESLKLNEALIRQSLELAKIDTSVPIELDLENLRLKEPNRKLAYELFRELEFSSLVHEFEPAEVSVESDEFDYELISNVEGLEKLIRILWEHDGWSFMVDDSNSDHKNSYKKKPPLGVAISWKEGVSRYVDIQNFDGDKGKAIALLGDILSNGILEKATYDYKRNLAVLKKASIEVESLRNDVMLAAYLLEPGRARYDLRTIASMELGLDMQRTIPEGWTEDQYKTAEQADLSFRLAARLEEKIKEHDLERVYREIELPLVPILYQMEVTGIKVDVKALNDFSVFIAEEIKKTAQKIYEIAGRSFNINSPKQVAEVLQSLGIQTGKKTATGQIATSKDILNELAAEYEIAKLIVEYRELEKLKDTYADALPELIDDDGRIHTNLNQTTTVTGRLSSSDPNLQNIPIRTELGRQIRKAFVPEKGNKLVSADYSQLELRILAHVTQDEVMLDAFRKGEDIHAKTARLVFGAETAEELKEKRRLAKVVNFAIAYAVEPYGLSQRVGITRTEAKKLIENYYRTYEGVRRYMKEIPEIARRQGYVSSIFGRRRYLPSINDRSHSVRARAEREAINMPIQGTASDIVKLAMIKTDRALKERGFKTQMIMQIHDELLFEAPEEEVEKAMRVIKEKMESAVELSVPLTVEIKAGDNWMEIKD
ncbi:MAG: DNA polymerase I [Pyrinomonadaceae bacterium]|nr:DNA polymerase I [Pyrinomonadaceae bacterium]MCX7638907.1 DNA polymerase I [Pyrinomonadaceae bacterium]MDW8304956.1 DNA polymerase I [Acidobacteriota bacterium]